MRGPDYGKLTRYLFLLLTGLVLVFYGLFAGLLRPEPEEISDRVIIERARELGMVPITETYGREDEEGEDAQ